MFIVNAILQLENGPVNANYIVQLIGRTNFVLTLTLT
jgi:hypothetical protein